MIFIIGLVIGSTVGYLIGYAFGRQKAYKISVDMIKEVLRGGEKG